MTSKIQHIQNLRKIFQKSVESVRPQKLLSEENACCLTPKAQGQKVFIQIQGETLDITNKRCHVVGFGKAVLGMAVTVEKQMGSYISSGILSIPVKSLQQFRDVPEMHLLPNSSIKIYEGAQNNQPDLTAMCASQEIKSLATKMTKDDILFVLISGGGSALLPLPKDPIQLQEKMHLVRELANKGATIDEMNVVRIALSDIKGGRLAAAARNAHAVISFVISDIVGDPVDLIASGPTCVNLAKRVTARDILIKYDMWDHLPKHICTTIDTITPDEEIQPGLNNSVYVVGDNRCLGAAAERIAVECGYHPFIVSTTITGDVRMLAELYTTFLRSIYRFRTKEIDEVQLKQEFPFEPSVFQDFFKTVVMCEKTQKPLLLILAGEPTIKVSGTGLGGRNQELALRMSLQLFENTELKSVTFLSAGTDGIDGPTTAAGAIGSNAVVEEFVFNKGSIEDLKAHLSNNNSFNFYKKLNDSKYHIITGHTGTNVMDLHLILVP